MYQQSIYSSLHFKNDNVGIGTATPLSKLHIHGDIQLSSNVRVYTLSDGRVYIDAIAENMTHVLNPLTTKGDLLVHDGTSEVRLPVGSNSTVLISDATSATGLAWLHMSNIQGNASSALFSTDGNDFVIHTHVIPSSNIVYDLGSASNRWRDLYLSGNTIDLGGVRISKAESGTGIQVVDQQNQPLATTTRELIATGNVGIGTSLPFAKLHISHGESGDILRIDDMLTDTSPLVIREDGNVGIGTTIPTNVLSVEGSIGVNGDVFSSGSVTAFAFSTLSDQTWKEDIQPVEDVLYKIRTLRPVNFVWSCNLANKHVRGTSDVGLIAQEVEPVIPKIMREYAPPGNSQKYKGIAYEKLTPYLVKAIQELDAEITELKKIVKDFMQR